jgi:hypothetical protein
MADILFSNTASSLLNTSINASVLTIELEAGFGSRFPSPSGAQYMLVTLEDDVDMTIRQPKHLLRM